MPQRQRRRQTSSNLSGAPDQPDSNISAGPEQILPGAERAILNIVAGNMLSHDNGKGKEEHRPQPHRILVPRPSQQDNRSTPPEIIIPKPKRLRWESRGGFCQIRARNGDFINIAAATRLTNSKSSIDIRHDDALLLGCEVQLFSIKKYRYYTDLPGAKSCKAIGRAGLCVKMTNGETKNLEALVWEINFPFNLLVLKRIAQEVVFFPVENIASSSNSTHNVSMLSNFENRRAVAPATMWPPAARQPVHIQGGSIAGGSETPRGSSQQLAVFSSQASLGLPSSGHLGVQSLPYIPDAPQQTTGWSNNTLFSQAPNPWLSHPQSPNPPYQLPGMREPHYQNNPFSALEETTPQYLHQNIGESMNANFLFQVSNEGVAGMDPSMFAQPPDMFGPVQQTSSCNALEEGHLASQQSMNRSMSIDDTSQASGPGASLAQDNDMSVQLRHQTNLSNAVPQYRLEMLSREIIEDTNTEDGDRVCGLGYFGDLLNLDDDSGSMN